MLKSNGWSLLSIATGLMCSVWAGPAKPSDQTVLSPADMMADVDVLQRAYTELHPGLYRYNSPSQVESNFDQLRLELRGHPSLAQIYLAYSRFAATVRCGHTYPNFYNQPLSLQKALFEGANRVPFYFVWLNKRMVVTRDFTSERGLPVGTQVIAIDGIPASEILRRLMTVARADGNNDAKRVALMEVQGRDKFESFDVYLPMLFPQIRVDQTLAIQRPGDTRTRILHVKALTYQQRLNSRPNGKSDETHGWKLGFPAADLAILTMPDWVLYDSTWDWKGFLAGSFKTIAERKVRTLVIDLRGNEGGLDVGEALLPFLVHEPMVVREPDRLVRYRKVPSDLVPFLDTWDSHFKDWGNAAVKKDDVFYTLESSPASPSETLMKPVSPHFDGALYVLVDASNSSATFQFEQQIQLAHLGTLVGQPTGGNQRGINGGAFFFLRLPNSHIEMDLPLIGTFPPGHPPDAGLTPDVVVDVTIDDVVKQRDSDMEAIWRLRSRPVGHP